MTPTGPVLFVFVGLDLQDTHQPRDLEQPPYLGPRRHDDELAARSIRPFVLGDDDAQAGGVHEFEVGQVESNVDDAFPSELSQLLVELAGRGRVELAREQHERVLFFATDLRIEKRITPNLEGHHWTSKGSKNIEAAGPGRRNWFRLPWGTSLTRPPRP